MVKVIIICVIDYIIRRDIVIVAAGIAGLTASFGLHRLGIRSLVLESSDTLRIARFALSKWENAWKALDAVGVGHILRQEHAQLMGCFWLNETKLVKLEFRVVTTSLITGQQTSAMRFKESGNQQTDREIRCVKRNLLLEVLANELPSGTIRYLSKVVAIEESGFYKILHLADGTAIKTKRLGFKNISFTGRYAIRGCAEFKNDHGFEPSFMQFFGKDKELEENPAKLKQYVLNKLENMPRDVRYYIEKIELDAFLSSPLRHRHPWELMFGNISKDNVCVGGDAFHPMTGDLGQGGCCAFEDGDQFKRIEGSLKKYAKERRWRSIDVIVTSYMAGSIREAESIFVTFLRDNILAAFLTSQLFKKSSYDCGKLNNSNS
uniref:FAD-binding domain-containing protein n=1 Tax=Glycine max TaxID=3847 RepID=A0A0R0I4V9_SOYBN